MCIGIYKFFAYVNASNILNIIKFTIFNFWSFLTYSEIFGINLLVLLCLHFTVRRFFVILRHCVIPQIFICDMYNFCDMWIIILKKLK